MDYYKVICWTECPFCLKAKNLLMEKNKQFEYCSIDDGSGNARDCVRQGEWKSDRNQER